MSKEKNHYKYKYKYKYESREAEVKFKDNKDKITDKTLKFAIDLWENYLIFKKIFLK